MEDIKHNDSKRKVMVGKLPDDFLRMPSSSPASSQEDQDRATAIQLQNQIIKEARQPVVGQLEMSFVNAVLNKNYGFSRMDPYVRLRLGNHVYETPTAQNGAKTPQWNKTFNIYNIPQGVNSFLVEVFDERTLTEDELIAWAHVELPESVWKEGTVIDEWYKLSGKLGEGQEGLIHVIMKYRTGPPPAPTVMMLPGYAAGYAPVPIYTMPPQNYAVVQPVYAPANPAQPPSQRPTPVIQEEDIKQLSEMFPSVEEAVIQSVLEASNGNKEAAINNLLQME